MAFPVYQAYYQYCISIDVRPAHSWNRGYLVGLELDCVIEFCPGRGNLGLDICAVRSTSQQSRWIRQTGDYNIGARTKELVAYRPMDGDIRAISLALLVKCLYHPFSEGL